MRHGDCVKTESRTKKELHALKQQLKEEHEMRIQANELQQEHEQQGSQHALMGETTPLQVIDPSQ